MLQSLHFFSLISVRLIVVAIPAYCTGNSLIAVPTTAIHAVCCVINTLSCQFCLQFRPSPGRHDNWVAECGRVTLIYSWISKYMLSNHVVGLPVLFKRSHSPTLVLTIICRIAITVQISFYFIDGHQLATSRNTKYCIFSSSCTRNTREVSTCHYALFVGQVCILIKMHNISLHIGSMINIVKLDFVLRVNLYVIGITIGALKEPHPTRTGAGTTSHLLIIHGLTIDIQVSVTIRIRINGLNLIACSQLIGSILHMIRFSIPEF